MSQCATGEYLQVIYARYQRASRIEKRRILEPSPLNLEQEERVSILLEPIPTPSLAGG